jgi:hypothetical protein
LINSFKDDRPWFGAPRITPSLGFPGKTYRAEHIVVLMARSHYFHRIQNMVSQGKVCWIKSRRDQESCPLESLGMSSVPPDGKCDSMDKVLSAREAC